MEPMNGKLALRRWAGLALWAALALLEGGLLLLGWPAGRPEAAAVAPAAPFPHGPAPQSHRVVATIPLGLGIGAGPAGIAANAATGLVYVTNSASDDVSIISGTQVITMVLAGEEPRTVATVEIGDRPGSTAVHPTLAYAYVTGVTSNTLSVFVGTTLVETIAMGRWPRAPMRRTLARCFPKMILDSPAHIL